jgi:hypothetical protein
LAANAGESTPQSCPNAWNGVPQSSLTLSRVMLPPGKHDILDGMVLDSGGNCVDIVDTTSPNLLAYDPSTGAIDREPATDIVIGGWLLDLAGPFDIQSVAVHEDGHALGLGHFGGPNVNQPFTLKPNLRVFDPEAVMNPFGLGGEKRALYGTDAAALRSLYSRR